MLLAMDQVQPKEVTEQIWRELSDRLRQFVRARINSPTDIDDVLQNVFLRIHSHFGDLRETDRLESWVFQITRNAVTDYFRKQRDDNTDAVDTIQDPSLAGAQNVHAEVAGCLNTLIERLPDDQRRAVSMYELEGMSQKEIATQESISLSGAKSRVQRGRRSLEAMLKSCCEFQFDRRGNVIEYESTDKDCGCDGSCE